MVDYWSRDWQSFTTFFLVMKELLPSKVVVQNKQRYKVICPWAGEKYFQNESKGSTVWECVHLTGNGLFSTVHSTSSPSNKIHNWAKIFGHINVLFTGLLTIYKTFILQVPGDDTKGGWLMMADNWWLTLVIVIVVIVLVILIFFLQFCVCVFYGSTQPPVESKYPVTTTLVWHRGLHHDWEDCFTTTMAFKF